jgi:hypothetical protein
MSRKQEHAEQVKWGMEQYEEAFVEAIAEVTENGEVIGLERLSKRTLLGFFNSVPPQEWYAASITDPEGALAMLDEYRESGGA